jgi:hypothetical protein
MGDRQAVCLPGGNKARELQILFAILPPAKKFLILAAAVAHQVMQLAGGWPRWPTSCYNIE